MRASRVGTPLSDQQIKRYAALCRLGVVAVALVAWQLLAQTGVVDKSFVSTPVDVAKAIGGLFSSQEARHAFRFTGAELLLGFAFGTSAGIVAGTAIGLSPMLRQIVWTPFLVVLSTPKSIFLPLFVIYMGIGFKSAVAFSAISAFFFVVVNVVGGVSLVEPRHIKAGRAYGLSRRASFFSIVLPSASPGIFAGLWQGVNQALGAVLIAELWASRDGIGNLITAYSNNLRADYVVAVMVVISFAAVLAGSAWSALERRTTRWRTAD